MSRKWVQTIFIVIFITIVGFMFFMEYITSSPEYAQKRLDKINQKTEILTRFFGEGGSVAYCPWVKLELRTFKQECLTPKVIEALSLTKDEAVMLLYMVDDMPNNETPEPYFIKEIESLSIDRQKWEVLVNYYKKKEKGGL